MDRGDSQRAGGQVDRARTDVHGDAGGAVAVDGVFLDGDEGIVLDGVRRAVHEGDARGAVAARADQVAFVERACDNRRELWPRDLCGRSGEPRGIGCLGSLSGVQ